LRPLAVLALLLAPLAAKPARRISYAESTDRLVYAFVFGHKDTCRVIRRPAPPPFGPDGPPRRFPDAWKGGAGETLLGEFEFGRRGRPLHIAVANDGARLVSFSNRGGPDADPQDSVWIVAKGDSEPVVYEGVPGFPEPAWPEHPRALAKAHPLPPDPAVLSYAFVTRELAGGRLLVARQSEDAEGRPSELSCFVLNFEKPTAKPPARGELLEMLKDEEPLMRGAAARQLGLAADREALDELKASLKSTMQEAARIALAEAIVRCGDRDGRKTLRALLKTEPEAARAIALLPPDPRDADELAAALGDLPERPALYVAVALARIGDRAARALAPCTRGREERERIRAATALGHIDDVTAERTLLRMVGDPKEEVRKAAARALTDPPRKIMESNYGEFAKALEAAGRTQTKSAAYRLATLAMHAGLKDDRILGALVDLTTFHDRAIEALRKLTGLELQTSDDWKRWWKER